MSIVDVNVLLPLLIPRHPAHGTAREWFDQQADRSVWWCLPIKLGMLRLLCNRTVMGDSILSPLHALDTWEALTADPRLQEVTRVPMNHPTTLRGLVAGRDPSPNLWTDAWLAALAIGFERELVTFDRGFRSFSGLNLRLLQVTSAESR